MKALSLLFILAICGCSGIGRQTDQRILKKVKEFDQLVVVHPTYYFDTEGEATETINLVASYFLKAEVPVITLVEKNAMISALQSNQNLGEAIPSKPIAANYSNYFKKIRRTQMIESKDGENKIRFKGTRIIVVGGYLAACLRTAVREVVQNNRSTTKPLKIYMPLDAIYGKKLVLKSGPKNREEMRKHVTKFLPKDTNLKFHIDRQQIFSIDNSGAYNIEVYLRRPKKSAKKTLMSF